MLMTIQRSALHLPILQVVENKLLPQQYPEFNNDPNDEFVLRFKININNTKQQYGFTPHDI